MPEGWLMHRVTCVGVLAEHRLLRWKTTR